MNSCVRTHVNTKWLPQLLSNKQTSVYLSTSVRLSTCLYYMYVGMCTQQLSVCLCCMYAVNAWKHVPVVVREQLTGEDSLLSHGLWRIQFKLSGLIANTVSLSKPTSHFSPLCKHVIVWNRVSLNLALFKLANLVGQRISSLSFLGLTK